MDLVKIAVMGLNEAKQFQKDCSAKGIELVLNHDDASCTRGCAVTVEVHAKETDLPVVQEIYSSNYMKLLEGHDVDPETLNAVFDPSAESATCPACGHTFSTTNSECPDCGLMF